MEVVSLNLPRRSGPTASTGIPFNKRNIEEWSRLDRLTGMMEKAKIETDHWSASTNHAAHKYGKMVDSRERNNSDGSVQQRQRKQMEVFQTQTTGGSMQVIRTQTVTTSSSKWASAIDKGFEDLQLPINALDLSSQKTKGSVGRSGSIGGRRPPSRPRSFTNQTNSSSLFGDASRLCQKLHDEAKNDMYKGLLDERFTNLGHVFNGKDETDSEDDASGVVITEITNSSENSSQRNNLSRQKSCSNENVNILDEDDDNGNSLRRSSKARRSLQFPKQTHPFRNDWNIQDNDITPGKSLKERAAEIESLLRRGSSTNTTLSQDSEVSSVCSDKPKPLKTRDSFVTVETLKEVRDRLKRASTNETDDGIVTEKEDSSSPSSKVKSFVFGMEAKMGARKNINGTGSLESRSSTKSSTNGSKSSEWYRRRKSYGFEHVDESEKFDKFTNKHMESSTDSGICQSSETVGTPAWVKVLAQKKKQEMQHKQTSFITVGPKADSVSTISSDPENNREDTRRQIFRRYTDESLPSEAAWNRKSPLPLQRKMDVRESLKSSLRSAKNPWLSQLRGTKLVDRKWITDEHDSDDGQTTEDTLDRDDPVKLSDLENGGSKKQKKVEFCKTEVHFAAESGKFNIVETDGKPPPTDIFKKRRRNSGPVLTKNLVGLPEVKFGDSTYEKKLLSSSDTITDKIEAELQELTKLVSDSLPPTKPEPDFNLTSKLPKLYDVEEENDFDQKPRSILKNYRKSYMLGEPIDLGKKEQSISAQVSGDAQVSSPPVWKSTVTLRNKRFDDVQKRNVDEGKLYSSDGESELQMRFRSLRRTDPDDTRLGNPYLERTRALDSDLKRRSLPDDILKSVHMDSSKMSASSSERPLLSVAERIKQVESTSYSSKINFRSGEMTVVQNGSERKEQDVQRVPDVPLRWERNDNKPTSNPTVSRLLNHKQDKTDSQQYHTTRILINIKSCHKDDATQCGEKSQTRPLTQTHKPVQYGSWTPGMTRHFTRHCGDLKSASLVIDTINNNQQTDKQDLPKPSKPVFEIINHFDALSLPRRLTKEKRRKTMPINYKAPKEYTHADLEEELKNFTDDLDKDFKDIYEKEIGSLKQSSKEVKKTFELDTLKCLNKYGDKSSTSSRGNFDSDDSDVLADEEVRSYMSTGYGGTDSEEEGPGTAKKSTDGLRDMFKKLNGHSDLKPAKTLQSHTNTFPPHKTNSDGFPSQRKIASIALRYEDDPAFSRTNHKSSVQISKSSHLDVTDAWEKASNSSSTYSDKPRERVSYLSGPSLSEKYSKSFQRSSNSSLDAAALDTTKTITKIVPLERKNDYLKWTEGKRSGTRKEEVKTREVEVKTTRSSFLEEESKFRSKAMDRNVVEKSALSSYKAKRKEREDTDSGILEQLARAADQILLAVNGYTDEDSHIASSEEDDKSRRIIKKDKIGSLGTIDEGKRVTKTEARNAPTINPARRGNHSSASSLESLTHPEPGRSAKIINKPVCSRTKQKEANKSRATRLLQRASSREALMAQPSSSEDIPSYVEAAKKRTVRRVRSATAVKAEVSETKTAYSRMRTKTRDADTSQSKTKDRKPLLAKDVQTAATRPKTSQPTPDRTTARRIEAISRRSVEKTEIDSRKKRTPLITSDDPNNSL